MLTDTQQNTYIHMQQLCKVNADLGSLVSLLGEGTVTTMYQVAMRVCIASYTVKNMGDWFACLNITPLVVVHACYNGLRS